MIIIVTGLPGTGKSTFSEALAQVLGCRRLNTDIIRTELGKRGQYDPETKALIYRELFRQAKYILGQHQSVIVDGTFYLKSLRQSFRQLAGDCQAPLYWIELRASEETIRRRIDHVRPDSEATFPVYLRIREQYEPMDEPRLSIWSDAFPIDQMVDIAVRYLNSYVPETE